MGVLGLALEIATKLRRAYSQTEVDTLLAAIVLHDVGTPAFAHLFEYLLKATSGWTHESMLERIIAGDYRPENLYHQVFNGRSLALSSMLESMDLDPASVVANVMGKGPLGGLVAGSVDLDNIDNVYRMSSALGLFPDPSEALSLTRDISVSDSVLQVSPAGLAYLQSWRSLRRRAYEVLAFDESAIQGQAMLTDCFSEAIDAEILNEEHWHLTDYSMVQFLLGWRPKAEQISNTLRRFVSGDFYATLFIGWFVQPRGERDLRHPRERSELKESLQARLKIPCSPYVFYDVGTFEKELRVCLASEGRGPTAEVQIGETSTSTIVGVFTPHRRTRLGRAKIEIVIDILADFGLDPESLVPIPSKREIYGLAGQKELPI
jgi:hypothetical protein